MMPKIPVKAKKDVQYRDRLDTKSLAGRLLCLNSQLAEVGKELSEIWEALYTKGLTERGPLTEGKDDIPF